MKEILLQNGDENYKNISELLEKIPTPPWRKYKHKNDEEKNENIINYIPTSDELDILKAAIYLRRPLLVTGKPGLGKSALAKSLVKELGLGELLHWQITTETILKDALYSYDAIGRLQDIQLAEKDKNISTKIESYLKLQALGTAFASEEKPKVLLIDELDKSDVDLPNNLLHIFEEGYFEIPELKRLTGVKTKKIRTLDNERVEIENGKVTCTHFPIVIMTSNGERDFPAAFKRRCLHIELHSPDKDELVKIVKSNLGIDIKVEDALLELFVEERTKVKENLSTDQLLNAIYLRNKGIIKEQDLKSLKSNALLKTIFKPLVD
ncbi:MAG: MoxR-like ATPases [uncultured Sulfurovum sp.]|uniref:MoxR-like ATPases n=1 Tax=uncultured Sulfurovum sp. TaxID=269237 RepID=A0A6S6TMP6_9BACT|nr:MAG: MoxR-like ATPases [uncultured Sulfurovum sp.]